MKIEIKTHYADWHETDETTARLYAEWLMKHIVMVPLEARADWIREHHVRGVEIGGRQDELPL